VFLLWRHWARQLSRNIPADAGSLCDKSDVLEDTIKRTLCILNIMFILCARLLLQEQCHCHCHCHCQCHCLRHDSGTLQNRIGIVFVHSYDNCYQLYNPSLPFLTEVLLFHCLSVSINKITQIPRFMWLTSRSWPSLACCCTLVVWPVTYVRVHSTGKPFSLHQLSNYIFCSSFKWSWHVAYDTNIFVDENILILFFDFLI
jgi:hypothetical protein